MHTRLAQHPPARAFLQPELAARRFRVDGHLTSYAELIDANHDDEDLCRWAPAAQVGEVYPAFVSCERVA